MRKPRGGDTSKAMRSEDVENTPSVSFGNRGVGSPCSGLGTSPRSLRLGGRSRPSAAGAVGLPGGGDPILLNPPAWRSRSPSSLAWLRIPYQAPVGLADIHLCRYLFVVLASHPPVLSSLKIDDTGGLGNYRPHQKGRGSHTQAPCNVLGLS
jgi:hypothetical protein